MENLSEWTYRLFDAWEFLAPRSRSAGEREHAVVYSPGHLGDFLQLTPMLKALRERMQGKEITWLIGAWCAELALRYKAWADEIVVLSPQKDTLVRGDPRWTQSVAGQWRRLREIRGKTVDWLLCPMPEDPIARFVANTLRPRIWVAVGDRRPPRVHPSIETRMLPFEKDRPEALAQLDLLAKASGTPGGTQKAPVPVFPLSGEEREWAGHFLRREGIGAAPLVLFAPGSGWKGKNWPPDRFDELARRLESRGMDIAWTGSAGDRALRGKTGRDWVGRFSLGQLAAIMERAAAWVGNDSGPMHLAVAAGCPTVSFWGPTNENKWGGIGERHVKLRGTAACPGCIYWDWRRDCPKADHPCMAAITPGMAEQAVLRVISGKVR